MITSFNRQLFNRSSLWIVVNNFRFSCKNKWEDYERRRFHSLQGTAWKAQHVNVKPLFFHQAPFVTVPPLCMPPHLIIHIIITTRSKGCMLACLACASPRLNDVFSFGLPRYLFHSCTALHVRHLLLCSLAATELCCAPQCHCNNGAPLWGGSGSKRRTRRPFSCCCCCLSEWAN